MNNRFTRIRCLLLIATILVSVSSSAQKKSKPGKYPSLLWEITGKGMKKPSYLFGTMHVSSKMAFHLGDSFYVALNNVDVVAIETKPEIWQQKLFENDDASLTDIYGLKNLFGGFPNNYLKKGSLAFGKYEKGIEVALAMEPTMVNNLLYRSYESNNDFEEDTYLDMYIYQIGCKLKKQTTGVEDYEETEKLVDEAYEDMYKEKVKKKRNYDVSDDKNSGMNLNDAYRNGDLDLLDSINRMNSTSDAFDEKFLYRRNEIQARSIDSIIKIHPLFVGVGAAHLPGNRGVIELLRKMGYTLRSIKMGERDGKQKDMIENLRVPVVFNQQIASDSFYKVMSPGKLYKSDNSTINRSQYADMSNGSYYVVSRLRTNSLMWGQQSDKTLKKVDSLLYENIPGKIIKKEPIVKNGYKGFNIINRTRKGDLQRYNIFVTPFEIIFFKISGTGDYISKGEEANKFFNSIELQPLKTSAWVKYTTPKTGFSIELPQQPIMSKENNSVPSRIQYDAFDNSDGNNYVVMRTDVHNLQSFGEDSFDLRLMDESFTSSDFIDRQLSSSKLVYKGYPALDCVYKHRDSSVSKVRFIIQGPHYYSLVAHGKKEDGNFDKFINSFAITPFVYGPSLERKDTAMAFTVRSPVYPDKKTDLKTMLKKLMRKMGSYRTGTDAIEESMDELKNFGTLNMSNDTTGEKIFLLFVKSPKYNYEKDSSYLTKGIFNFGNGDSSIIFRTKKETILPNGFHVLDVAVTDSNSSRLLKGKFFTRDGAVMAIVAVTDTLTKPSSFLTDVFATLTPADTLKSESPFTKKTNVFFADYFSGDSLLRKKTLKALDELYVDSSDGPMIKKALTSLSWADKDYLETKGKWIRKFGDIKDASTTDYLSKLYKDAGDTTSLQSVILSVLLDQETAYSYKTYKDIFMSDPPAPDASSDESTDYVRTVLKRSRRSGYKSSYDGSAFDDLYDSLALTKTIFNDMLPLINVDDYKTPMLTLLAAMVDSGYISAKGYEPYFSKIYLEAKSEMKKQLNGEKQASLQKAIKEAEKKDNTDTDDSDYKESDNGNESLILYGRLLIPYWDKNAGVPTYFQQALKSSDKKLKYDASMLLLKSGKLIPDTMLSYYAGMDDYRYQLFTDLKEMDMLEKFPSKFKDLMLFAKAKLHDAGSYSNNSDTLVYLEKFKVDYKYNKGWLYFFKYKQKKDDTKWKIAITGLMPDSIDSFFVKRKQPNLSGRKYEFSKSSFDLSEMISGNDYHYTSFTKYTDEVITDEESLEKQLQQQFKEILYSLHKSATEFYSEENDWYKSSLYGMKE